MRHAGVLAEYRAYASYLSPTGGRGFFPRITEWILYIQGSCCINLRFYAKVALTKKTGERMNSFKTALFVVLVALLVIIPYGNASAGQVWTKCHITCRCLQDNSVGNFLFNIPLDTTPDVGFDADLACNQYAYRTCADGCNGTKFSYTYQVTSP